MAFSLGELYWKITGDTSGIDKSLDKTYSKVGKTATGFTKLGGIVKKALTFAAVTYAVKKVYDLGKAIVVNSGQAQRNLDQLNQVIKSTGGVAGVTSEELQKMAQDLSEVTEFEDDAIIKSQALMLTFTKIGKDVFPDATEAVLNLSAALGQDLQASTVQVGKALNDPIQGITALRRVGVQLSAAQEEQIRNFVALNDVASAQKIILGELSTQFGGTAKAVFANNPAMMFAKAQQQVGNILEKVGDEHKDEFLALGKAMVVAAMDGAILSKNLSLIGEGLGAATKQITKYILATETLDATNDIKKSGKNIKELTDQYKDASSSARQLIASTGDMALINNKSLTLNEKLLKLAQKGDISAVNLNLKLINLREKSNELIKESIKANERLEKIDEAASDISKKSEQNQKEINNYLKDRAKLINTVSDNQKKANPKEELNKAKENANALSKAYKSITQEQKAFIEASRTIAKEDMSETLDNLDKYPPAIRDAIKGFNELSAEESKALEEATALYKSGKISLGQYNVLWGSLAEKARSYYDVLNAMPTEQLAKLNIEIGEAANKSESFADVWNNMDFKERTQFISDQFNQMGAAIGNVFSSIAEYVDAMYQSQIDALDNAMKAELEAAGIHEETATEKAEADLARAKESGDAEAILEAEKALKKAKIEEKYQKKKMQLEYEMEMARWKFQLASATAAVPLAILNALASGWAAGPVMGPILGPLYAGLAGLAGAIQLAAVAKSKPEAPKFENGGIVGGQSYSGDNVTARVNSGELILNKAQQNNLAGQMSNIVARVVNTNEETLWNEIFNATRDGRLLIADRSLVAR